MTQDPGGEVGGGWVGSTMDRETNAPRGEVKVNHKWDSKERKRNTTTHDLST